MKKILFRFSLAPLTMLVSFVTCFYAGAQNTNNSGDKKMLDSLLLSEHLDTLQGSPVTLYSYGYNTRAKAIQALVRSCIGF